jgi:hypothetical protein
MTDDQYRKRLLAEAEILQLMPQKELRSCGYGQMRKPVRY